MAEPAIHTSGLSKRYADVDALSDLDLDVHQGEVVGYLGPNGSGKTTTLRLLLGLIRPTSGSAEIFGLDCQRRPVEAHRRLAYVAGEANLWPSLTGSETLHLLGRVQGQVDAAYRGELIARFDLDPSKKVRTYSKGNRQKLILIAALMARPDLLLLDEPASSLDPLARRALLTELVEAVAADGTTVLLSSHLIADVERVCDHLVILSRGRVQLAGDIDTLREEHQMIVGPRMDPAAAAADPTVVSAHHADRESALLVRCPGKVPPDGWRTEPLSLEDLVLAYLENPAAGTPAPAVAVGVGS